MIIINLKNKRPIYLQIIENIEDLVIRGMLKPNEQLPSVRNLAIELSINPNTIQRAYLDLENRGIIYSIPGKGSFVSPNQEDLTCAKKEKIFEELANLVVKAKLLHLEWKELSEEMERLYFPEGEREKND